MSISRAKGLNIAYCMTQYTHFIKALFTLKMSHFLTKVNDKFPVKRNFYGFSTENLPLNFY